MTEFQTGELRDEDSTSPETSGTSSAITLEDLPVPINWHVLIKPVPPKEVTGAAGLVLADTSIEAQEVFNYIGQIVAIGELAYKARTTSNLDVGAQKRLPKVGDWVIMPYHVGQEVRVRDPAGRNGTQRYKIVKDTDVIAIVADPDKYWTWVKT